MSDKQSTSSAGPASGPAASASAPAAAAEHAGTQEVRVPLLARLRRLAPYFDQPRWAWVAALLTTMVAASTEPMLAEALKRVIDSGFTDSTMPLWQIPILMVGLFILRGAAQFSGQYSLARITNQGVFRIRTMLFSRLMSADLRLYRQQSASKLANTLVYETQLGAQSLVQALVGVTRDGFSLIALVGYLLFLNWKLTILAFFMAPLIAMIMKAFSRRLYKVTKLSQAATDELAYVVEENALAYRDIRLHAAQQRQAERFTGLSRRLEGLAVRSTIASAAMTPTTQILAAASLSVIICLALWQSRTAAPGAGLTVGEFTAFATAMLLLVSPMRRLSDVANPLTRGVAALERGLSLLDDSRDEVGGTEVRKKARGEVSMRGVVVQFEGQSVPTLNGIDLHIPAGETVALVGPSGAGKTTLVNLLPHFLEPSRGQVLLDDLDVGHWDLASLRSQIAMVSQDVVMLNVSLAENVALGQVPDENRVRECLEAANLGELLASLPQGIHTLVGHNASQLSGGQRQRLAIARALYKDAPLLILDEATSALDSNSERLVQEALQRLMHARTTLVIAHRLATIEHADRVLVIERGRIIEQGTHAQLLACGGLYAMLHANAPTHASVATGGDATAGGEGQTA